jgi:hypothetical protein
LLEHKVSSKIEEVYADLKTALIKENCKVLSEQPPTQIAVKQGSLWGISPKTAKKTIKVNLAPFDGGTHLSFSSKLSADWKNITVVGCVLAAVLVGVCLWMASDLGTFMVTREPSFWSWLIAAGANVNLQAGQVFVNLAWGLAVFLSVVILLEAAIVVYVGGKIDVFAREIGNQLN